MKLGPVTKPDKRNKTLSKKFEDDAMSSYYDVIVIFPIYSQFGSIWKPDSGRIIYVKLTFSLKITFYLTKLGNRTKTYLIQFLQYCFE